MHNLNFYSYYFSKHSGKKNRVILNKFHILSQFLKRCLSNELLELKPKEKPDYLSKIIYNEFLVKRKEKNVVPVKNEPICLKYLLNEKPPDNEPKDDIIKPQIVHFPYEIKKRFLKRPTIDKSVVNLFSESVADLTPSDNENLSEVKWNSREEKIKLINLEDPKKWMVDEEEEVENDSIEEVIKFGTCDTNAPVSSTPCGGCGALLHCNNMSIPGFLPKEVFYGKTSKELQSEICQRCHFLKEFDVALGVNVSSLEYPKIISQIKNKKALAVLLIDLLDFPCSFWPGIIDLIGSRPLIIVGNKIDLFIQEGPTFLQNMKQCLLKFLENQRIDMERVKHVALISAKTGFGVEELINKLYKNWAYQGDVYLIGCTNAGKSTLFNALIQSDYCKIKATDLLHRATISAWPGTTLNLLKFPIMAPVGWKLYARTQRLMKQAKEKHAYEKLKKMTQNIRFEQITLTGHVGRTFRSETTDLNDDFTIDKTLDDLKPAGLNPTDPDFAQSKWCYDTPGVVHHDQIVNLLTTSELLLTLPKSMIIPRNFHLKPGTSLFIGGLARLDYISGSSFVWFTVYSSKELPVTITKLEDADDVYKELLGSELLRVPYGEKKRLEKWPPLSSKKFEICGRLKNEAAADIVLSSAGWISVALPPANRCFVEGWTPEGRGIHLRKPPIIKKGHTFRGNRIQTTPAFKVLMKEIEVKCVHEDPELK